MKSRILQRIGKYKVFNIENSPSQNSEQQESQQKGSQQNSTSNKPKESSGTKITCSKINITTSTNDQSNIINEISNNNPPPPTNTILP
jgi:hypothetical protein